MNTNKLGFEKVGSVVQVQKEENLDVAKVEGDFPPRARETKDYYTNGEIDPHKFTQYNLRCWKNEEQLRIAEVTKHTSVIIEIMSNLFKLHKINAFGLEKDFMGALFKGIVGVIIDWVWRSSEHDFNQMHLYLSNHITPWRHFTGTEDTHSCLLKESINTLCADTKKILHQHYLSERKPGQPKWYLDGCSYEWLTDREGDVGTVFVKDFVYRLGEITRGMKEKNSPTDQIVYFP